MTPTGESSKEELKLAPKKKSFLKNILLTINCVLQIPIYGMLLCFILYLILLYYSSPIPRSFLISYWVWTWFDKTPKRGGWDEDTGYPLPWLQVLLPKKYKFHWNYRSACRSNLFFKGFAEYCDMELVKTVDLDPKRNYLFLYHPHGVISMGANCGLSTNGCDFEKVFPGIHRSGAILDKIFYAPFFRDWMLMIGCIAPNRSTLKKQLTTTTPFHKSVVLIPGGAAEAIHAHPGIMRLHLRNRKGFIKIALETGCSLVPCIGFGENEMFDTLYGHKEEPHLHTASGGKIYMWIKDKIVHVQNKAKEFLSFTVPVLTHIVPRPQKVTVVVGKPMHFKETTDFTQEAVDRYHELYLNEIKKLHDEHKESYGVPGVELEIV